MDKGSWFLTSFDETCQQPFGTSTKFEHVFMPSPSLSILNSLMLICCACFCKCACVHACGIVWCSPSLKEGEPQPDNLFQLNHTQYLPDLITVLMRGRSVLIFPEGRLVQAHVEPRDSLGRWVRLGGAGAAAPDAHAVAATSASEAATSTHSEPGALVSPFHSGVGRLVAHSGARVLPVAHAGLDAVLPCADCSYKLDRTELRLLGPAHVAVHFGAPLDFRSRLRAFEEAHPHLVPFSDPGAFSAPDAMGPEKRALYREITDEVRRAVVRAHARALEEAQRQGERAK